MTCRDCGADILYLAERFAWVHTAPADHGPLP